MCKVEKELGSNCEVWEVSGVTSVGIELRIGEDIGDLVWAGVEMGFVL